MSSPDRAGRSRALRVACGYGLVVAVVPYATLKVLWLSGVMVGVPADSPARHFAGPNAVTLALDVVAVVVALSFTHHWGRRLPAWLVLPPVWVGTGFLVPVVGEVVAGFAHNLLTTGRPVNLVGGLVTDWAYVVVYVSFAVQGVLLTLCFVLYARDRWSTVLGGSLVEAPAAPALDAERVLAVGGALAAVAVAALRLFAAFGAPAGWHEGGWTFTTRLHQGVQGALALAAAVGVLALAGAVPALTTRLRARVAVVLAWTGSGAMVSWGLLNTLSLTARLPLSETITATEGSIALLALLGGVLTGTTALTVLARRGAVGGVGPVQSEAP